MAKTIESQHGIALLAVLMLLVLLSTMAIYTAEQQDLSIRRVSNIRQSEQAFQIAVGGEQWAVKILEKDMVVDTDPETPDFDHAREDWANLGAPVKVEGSESIMQVTIFDEQGKFNINNLVQGKVPVIIAPGSQQPGQQQVELEPEEEPNQEQSGQEQPSGQENQENAEPQPSWYSIFQRLLLSLDLDPLLADVIVDWIDSDSNTTGTTGAEDLFYTALPLPYRSANQQITSLAELGRLRGFNSAIINKLSPYITAIQISSGIESGTGYTRINVNTASSRLLGALAVDFPVSDELFLSILEYRMENPFESVAEFLNVYSSNVPAALVPGIEPLLDVKSDYFVSRSCAETGDVKLSQISLLRKNRDRENVTVLYRQSNHGCPKIQPDDIQSQQRPQA